MFSRFIVVAIVFSLVRLASAADAPPSEASVKQLLELSHAHQVLDNMMSQMDGLMRNAMQQATHGQSPSPEVQKSFEKARNDVQKAFKEKFTWSKLEPVYVRIYQKSWTQDEIDGMIAFYKTPTGQSVINKMPVVMQNSMNETMQMMAPLMERVEQMQQEMASETDAKK
jgi:hypothetical protein